MNCDDLSEMTTTASQNDMTATEKLQELSSSERDALLLRLLEQNENRADPYKWQNKYAKERRKNDHEWRSKMNKRNAEYIKERCEKDPEYLERRRETSRRWAAAHRTKKKDDTCV